MLYGNRTLPGSRESGDEANYVHLSINYNITVVAFTAKPAAVGTFQSVQIIMSTERNVTFKYQCLTV